MLASIIHGGRWLALAVSGPTLIGPTLALDMRVVRFAGCRGFPQAPDSISQVAGMDLRRSGGLGSSSACLGPDLVRIQGQVTGHHRPLGIF
jgi:hypothetical protein